MHSTVNPTRFIGKDVTLSPLARGQSAVLLDGLRIGRVSHTAENQNGSAWLWSLTGPHCDCFPSTAAVLGEARSLNAAKLQLRDSFDVWLRWALEQDGPVHWHWTETTTDQKPHAVDDSAALVV